MQFPGPKLVLLKRRYLAPPMSRSRTPLGGKPACQKERKIMLKKTSLFLITIFALAFSGCQSAKNAHFAIYLLAQDIPAPKLSQGDLDQLNLKSEPLIASDDIISYDANNHVMELTQAAYTRLQQIFPLPVKVDGIPFVVCVGKEPIYIGAFWTPVSSLSYDGVVIMQPFEAKATTVQIALGYPVSDVFTGNDPRADSRIMKALEQDKKLK